MAKGRRWLTKLFLFLLLLFVVSALGLNLFRLTFQPPEAIEGSVTRLRNAYVDVYAAKNGARVILFDTGTDPIGRGLDALLAGLSASRSEVTDVFFTHGHGDHTSGASLLPNAKFHAGARDAGLIDGSDVPLKLRILGWLQPSAAVKVSDPLEGPSDVDVGGGQKVKAIPLPGHTPGSYVYLWEKVLFVGDTINYDAKKGLLETPPEFTNSDSAQLRSSLAGWKKSVAGLKFDRICTGHGGCTPPAETTKLLDDLIKRMQ